MGELPPSAIDGDRDREVAPRAERRIVAAPDDSERQRPSHGTDISEGEAAERLAYFGLDSETARQLDEVRNLIALHIEGITDGFYAHLQRFEGLRHFLDNPTAMERLRSSMRDYLLSLGQDLGSRAYFAERFRIGLVHERIGLGPKWFLGAFSRLFELIAGAVADTCSASVSSAEVRRSTSLLSAVHRVLALDATLMTEMYHRTSTDRLEAMLDDVNKAQSRLRRRASLDGLTHVLNRDALYENLEIERHRCACNQQAFALLIIDIDRFKQCNDRFGHEFGDQVLKQVAQCVRSVVRPWDVVGRLGGDEFVVGLVGTNAVDAEKIADRIRLRLSQGRIETASGGSTTTVSIGIAAKGTNDSRALKDLLREADRALYCAKAKGRNWTAVAGEDESVQARPAQADQG